MSKLYNRARQHILKFSDIGIKDVELVGGKNASLGEMYQKLKSKGVPVPNGFAVTAQAYKDFISENKLDKKINDVLKGLNTHNIRALSVKGAKIRHLILNSQIPDKTALKIYEAYAELSKSEKTANLSVAVRSSATAEDLPGASFAGQQETYLNIRGEKEILEAVKKCFASLFTDRAISYRVDKGFDQTKIYLSVTVQKMVRSDVGASGVMFSLDTDSGFRDVVIINSAYGLGENVVKGAVNPDEFVLFKPLLGKVKSSIISKQLGTKKLKMIYTYKGDPRFRERRSPLSSAASHSTKNVNVSKPDRERFSITEKQAEKLARAMKEVMENVYTLDVPVVVDVAVGKNWRDMEGVRA